MSTAKKSGSCPYAVAVSDDEHEAISSPSSPLLNSTSTSSSSSTSIGHVLELARTSCPAFSQHSCPFSHAKTAEEVRQALLEVPPSHLQQDGAFSTALSHLHHVSGTLASQKESGAESYVLPGGCPVQTYYQRNAMTRIPFVQAMEEYSLAAIMAGMAEDLHQDDDDEEEDQDEKRREEMLANKSQTQKTLSLQADTKLPSSTTSTPTTLLSQALKTGTAASHQNAENVHFVRNFIKGKIDRHLYAQLVLQLFHVYAKLEELLDRHAREHFSDCHFPRQLNRTETLREDVEFWHGDSPAVLADMTPATRDYVNRLEEIAHTEPLMLLSHAYTRYLGDLSGGKILARVARRALQLDAEGLRFYEFDHVPSAKLFKDQYRQALDHMELSADQIQRLVGEANVAFVLNMRLFEELDVMANIPEAKVRDLKEALEFGKREGDSDCQKMDEKCPFAKIGSSSTSAANSRQMHAAHDGKRCPWPFVFFHDWKQGMQDFQTWIVVGLLLCWLWSCSQRVSAESV